MAGWRAGAGLAAVLLVAACAKDEVVLPGERFDLRDLDAPEAAAVLATTEDPTRPGIGPQPPREIPLPAYSVVGEGASISLPAARAVSDWRQVAQNAGHLSPHAQLSAGPLGQIWAAPLGTGSSDRTRMGAQPVSDGARVYAMDADFNVSAVGPGGAPVWRQALTPAGETPGEVSGGGMAVSDGKLFVTTGFGRLHALDAATGAPLWVQKFGGATPAAPLVDGGLVYVVSRDGFGSAVDAGSGRILWQVEGSPAAASVLGSGVPAIAGKAVVFPFGDGELLAVLREAGVSLWSASVAGERTGRAYAGVGGVAGGPVVAGDTMYVATESGRLAALDAATGARLWTTLEGATGPVVAAGGSLFLMSDEARLLRISAADGALVWAATLPLFEEAKIRRRKDVFVHYGPILAGGRLILASTDGLMREVDPATGTLLRATQLGAPAASAPIVVNGVLYVITQDGTLRAFR